MKTIQDLQDATVAFAEEKFPAQPTSAKIKHLQKEVRELLDAPDDHMELADCLLLLLQVAARAKVSGHALVECAFTKLEICKRRTWGKPDRHGVVRHIEEAA